MNIAEFRRRSEQAFVSKGFRKLTVRRGLTPEDAFPVYTIDQGEIIRFFSPHALRRPWGCQMQGSFGVDFPQMRKWMLSIGKDPYATLSYYMTNEPQFMSPIAVSSERDWEDMIPWFDAICSRVLSLPSSFEELEKISGTSDAHLRLLFKSCPDFWSDLGAWQISKRK